MSTDDIRNLAKELNKPAAKRDWIKIFIGLSCFIIIGWYGGDWHGWRHGVDKTLDRHENMLQNQRNQQRADYNNSIVPKTVSR